MKKSLLALLAALTIFGAGCSSEETQSTNNTQPTDTQTAETTETQSTEEQAQDTQGTSETVEVPPYEIYSVEEDINTTYGTKYGGKTYQVYVIAQEEVNMDQLKAICQAAAEEVKKTHSDQVDAILIYPYDYPEYIGHGHVMGQAVLKSDGSWEWDLMEKDWSQRLTPEEVEVWAAWQELIKQKHEENPDGRVDEKVVTSEIAKQFGITPEKVDEILMKQAMWSL